MIKFFSILALGFVSTSVAFAGVFDRVTNSKSVCYSRTYSKSHMAKLKKQTVKKMDVKLLRDSGTNLMNVDIVVRGGKKYSAGFACSDNGQCGIDCDGGSARIEKKGSRLKFTNFGFIAEGGCEDPDKTIWVDNKKGGDDVFLLNPATCK